VNATADLPVVDLGSESGVDSLRRGLEETGFLYLVDHEVPPGLLAAFRDEALAFFARPPEEKRRYQGFLRGYAAVRAEDTESGFGTGAYGGGDLCEKYTMGYEPPASDRAEAPDYYGAEEAQDFFATNVFPDEPFGRTWLAYFDHMQRLSRRLVAAVRATLGLPPGAWRECIDRPADILRFLHYPEIASDGPRMAAHYDDNLLTLLHQSTPRNGFAALQVMLPGETRWRAIEPDDRYFVVNVGDALMYLTEGRAIATKHRVATPPPDCMAGSERTSAVFFHLPNYDCPLRPIVPATVDPALGQARSAFALDRLRDPDGSIPYWRLLRREAELGFTR
jgi:isopenicillin N synthase-like dioxygenase